MGFAGAGAADEDRVALGVEEAAGGEFTHQLFIDRRVRKDELVDILEDPCAEALEAGLASGDVILTVLARRRQPTPPPSITTHDALRLKIEPAVDCGRYDSIRKIA